MTTRSGDGGKSKIESHPNATHPQLCIKERIWDVPAGVSPVAGLVIIHGGNWHSGWFGELGDLLSSDAHRIRVSAPDLPAHGLSDDVVPPYRAYVPDFGEHANEVCAAVNRARESLRDEACPIFLLGESMGGTVCLHSLVMNDEETLRVDGLLLCGAVLRPTGEVLPPPMVVRALKLVSWLLPTMRVPGSTIGGKTFEEAFGDPTIGPIAREDPLVTEDSPPRIGYGLSFISVVDMLTKDASEKVHVKSLFMMHYEEDCRAMYAPTKALVDSLKTQDKVMVTLEGTAHQAFQDTPEKSKEHGERVARFITDRGIK